MTHAVSIVRAAGQGERLWFHGGGIHTWKATAEETGGAFLLFEDEMLKGKTSPLHLHPHDDETFYVLEGEILVHIDGEEHRVGAGGMTMVPRGVPHAFMVSSESARILCLLTPGTSEAFYRGASDPAHAATDPGGPPDFDRVRASAERNGGIELLGPPPFGQPAKPGSS